VFIPRRRRARVPGGVARHAGMCREPRGPDQCLPLGAVRRGSVAGPQYDRRVCELVDQHFLAPAAQGQEPWTKFDGAVFANVSCNGAGELAIHAKRHKRRQRRHGPETCDRLHIALQSPLHVRVHGGDRVGSQVQCQPVDSYRRQDRRRGCGRQPSGCVRSTGSRQSSYRLSTHRGSLRTDPGDRSLLKLHGGTADGVGRINTAVEISSSPCTLIVRPSA